jgi:hypothetical protein
VKHIQTALPTKCLGAGDGRAIKKTVVGISRGISSHVRIVKGSKHQIRNVIYKRPCGMNGSKMIQTRQAKDFEFQTQENREIDSEMQNSEKKSFIGTISCKSQVGFSIDFDSEPSGHRE